MNTYNEALAWIETKAKEYGSQNKFYASEEYKVKYPEIQHLHKKHIISIAEKGKAKMNSVNAIAGQKVYYDIVGAFAVKTIEGIIVLNKQNIPKVKTNDGKTVNWHVGFKPIKEMQKEATS